jgi:hypothetical protein
MAAVRAVKSGNWSDPTVWSTGTVPTSGDTVYSNTFTVTIDQDVLIGDTNNYNVNAGSFISGQWYEVVEIGTTNFTTVNGSNTVGAIFLANAAGSGTGIARTVATLTNAANTGAGASVGGGFSLSTNRRIHSWLRPSTSILLTITASGGIIEIIGVAYGSATNNIFGNTHEGNSTINFIGNLMGGLAGFANNTSFRNNSSGTFNVTGEVNGGVGGNTSYGIINTSNGIVNITGIVRGGNGSITSHGAVNTGTGTINIIGDVYGGGSSNGTAHAGVVNTGSSGTINITGNVYGGPRQTCRGVTIDAGTLNLIGNVYAGTGPSANGVSSSSFATTTNINFLGSSYDDINGNVAFFVRKIRNLSIPPQAVRVRAVNGLSTTVTYYTVDNSVWDYPAIQDVRNGVFYANNNLIGNCKIPSLNNVVYNVPVDNTLGTAVLKPENVWDYLKNNIDTEGSIGERLKNAVTANDMGKILIDTLT